MRIALLTPDDFRARVAHDGGALGTAATDEALRDVLLGEIHALGSTFCRTLLDRVADRVALAEDNSDTLRERLGDLLDALGATGDIFLGAGGLVGAAPLRAAFVDNTLALLFGSHSTASLRRRLPMAAIEAVPVRRAVVTHGDTHAMEVTLRSLGATTTTVARWARLDRVPREIAAWRAELTERLDGAMSHDRFEPGDDVRVYVADPAEPANRRWRSAGKVALGASPRLERHRRPGGWFAYAWVTGDVRHPLSRDEGLRTACLLDAEAGAARRIQVVQDGVGAHLDLDLMLPSPEYRLLLGVGRREGDEGASRRWCIASAAWPEVRRALTDGLGLQLDEGA